MPGMFPQNTGINNATNGNFIQNPSCQNICHNLRVQNANNPSRNGSGGPAVLFCGEPECWGQAR